MVVKLSTSTVQESYREFVQWVQEQRREEERRQNMGIRVPAYIRDAIGKLADDAGVAPATLAANLLMWATDVVWHDQKGTVLVPGRFRRNLEEGDGGEVLGDGSLELVPVGEAAK